MTTTPARVDLHRLEAGIGGRAREGFLAKRAAVVRPR